MPEHDDDRNRPRPECPSQRLGLRSSITSPPALAGSTGADAEGAKTAEVPNDRGEPPADEAVDPSRVAQRPYFLPQPSHKQREMGVRRGFYRPTASRL